MSKDNVLLCGKRKLRRLWPMEHGVGALHIMGARR